MSIKRFERRYDITLDQALNLNTNPVFLEAPNPGYAFQLVSYSVIRNGPRFATQVGWLQARLAGGVIRYADLGSNNWLTLIDNDPNRHCYIGTTTFVGGASDGISHYGSHGVELWQNVGNMTADSTNPGAPLIITIEWRLLPTYAETA